jgi:hypothetical protein
MSEDWNRTDFAFFTIIIVICGIFGFFIGMAVSTTYDVEQNFEFLEQVRQAEIDCKNEIYYYMDSHRTFCDKIGVTP